MEANDPNRPWVPVQLRIGFSAPTAPCSMLLELEGLSVHVDSTDTDLATAYLSAVGVTAEVDALRGLRFPVRDLAALASLPDQVTARAVGGLVGLLEAVVHPPADGGTVTVTMDGPTTLNLSWSNGTRRFDEQLPLSCAPALIAASIPFVAASDTWDAVLSASRMPIVVGRAKVNLDGFVEILATAPQRIEASPLPGLFRVDATHYGVALAYADRISAAQGFVWDGPKPVGDQTPTFLAEPTLPLSDHVRDDLRTFVDALTSERGRVVVWPAGLGRRVFCLAGVESLQAFPLLIVCGAHAVWSWQRNVALFGRSVSMHHDRDDVRIMTYEELERNPRVSSPAAIIFDDLARALETNPAVLDQLRRFDGLIDAVRISCSQDFPTDQDAQVRILSVIRPGEFRTDIPVALRYPGDPGRRLAEHLSPYLMRRSTASGAGEFARSTVEVLDTPRALSDIFTEIRQSQTPVEDRVSALLNATSAGTALVLSPKLARTVELARAAYQAGRSVAVVTRHQRTATLLRGLLRPLPVLEFTPGGEPMSGITVVTSPVADLRGYDEVVFIDYPWSTATIDAMVGDPGSQRAPSRVTLLHLTGSIDDRVAVVAGKRRERSSVVDPNENPTPVELRWMLAF